MTDHSPMYELAAIVQRQAEIIEQLADQSALSPDVERSVQEMREAVAGLEAWQEGQGSPFAEATSAASDAVLWSTVLAAQENVKMYEILTEVARRSGDHSSWTASTERLEFFKKFLEGQEEFINQMNPRWQADVTK